MNHDPLRRVPEPADGPQPDPAPTSTRRPAARSQAPDSLLARRAATGDVEAFSLLYRRHAPWVYRIALSLCSDRGDAEDITQDVFIQVWQSLAAFRGDSGVSTWIRRICINRCIRSGRRRHAVPTATLGDGVVSDRPDPAAAAVLTDDVEALQRALAELPEPQRVALVLRELGQLSYEEVAEVLDISLTAARARIYRGRLEVVRRLRPSSPQLTHVEAG